MSLRLEQRTAARRLTPIRGHLARRPAWERRYAWSLVAIDAVAVSLAGALGEILRFGFADTSLQLPRGAEVAYSLVAATLVPAWLVVIAMGGGYEPKVLGVGTEEYRRVFNSALRFFAVAAIVIYLTRLRVSRGFITAVIPLATVFTLMGRYGARRWLHRQRARGRRLHRVLVVGSIEAASNLVHHLQRVRYAGFNVVAACLPSAPPVLCVGENEVPVFGDPSDLLEALVKSQADAVAVAGSSALPPGELRKLAWQLEGSGIDLIVAPEVTDVAGPRIVIRPVAGLPLLHVEEPALDGAGRVLKGALDRSVAAVALALLLPALIVIGLVIRLTSPGSALFRQERVGRNGRSFRMLKFRSMVETAEDDLDGLLDLNEHDGLLFKMRHDPRCTAVGRWLRRYSLDELPQLWHVITGHMSLVGPRPPLPREVALYSDDVRRRLLVKPGMTGLWQVSGRADLAWEEAVRLDLYYIENWSPALDLVILAKTAKAVIRSRGAF